MQQTDQLFIRTITAPRGQQISIKAEAKIKVSSDFFQVKDRICVKPPSWIQPPLCGTRKKKVLTFLFPRRYTVSARIVFFLIAVVCVQTCTAIVFHRLWGI